MWGRTDLSKESRNRGVFMKSSLTRLTNDVQRTQSTGFIVDDVVVNDNTISDNTLRIGTKSGYPMRKRPDVVWGELNR